MLKRPSQNCGTVAAATVRNEPKSTAEGGCATNKGRSEIVSKYGLLAAILFRVLVAGPVLLAAAAVHGAPAAQASPAPAGAARQAPRPYAVVVDKKTAEDAGWKGVVDALQKKHAARVFNWDGGDLKSVCEDLKSFRPYYVCFVARPEELARAGVARGQTPDGRTVEIPLQGGYYHQAGLLMCSLGDDPYDGAIWAVVTGATPDDALRVVSAKPLTVRRGLSHVGTGWLEWMESGVSFSEGEKGRKWVKQPGKVPEAVAGPDDTTKEFVAELNGGAVGLVSTSGHATEHDWQLGFSYANGQIVTPSAMGRLPEAARENYKRLVETAGARPPGGEPRLVAVDRSNKVFEILGANPKVYYSPGNCLIARVDGPDCMALGWIHCGAMQFFGHVGLQTRSCYAWGIAEYFLALPGRFTFAEAVWLNHQAMRWELGQMTDADKKQKYICCRNETPAPDGRQFFWETTVLYGDPAWESRTKAATEPLYDQALRQRPAGDGRTELTFMVTMRRPSAPTRPAAFLLDAPVGPVVEVKEGPANLVVARRFALVPFWKSDQPAPEAGRQYKAVVIVERAK